MGKLINRIPGSGLLIASLPFLALRTHVELLGKPRDVNKLSQNSEHDQEIPHLQTTDNPWHREEEPLNHHETPGRQIKQSNQLSLHHQDDCNTRMDIK